MILAFFCEEKTIWLTALSATVRANRAWQTN
jgi:hypothetical protein